MVEEAESCMSDFRPWQADQSLRQWVPEAGDAFWPSIIHELAAAMAVGLLPDTGSWSAHTLLESAIDARHFSDFTALGSEDEVEFVTLLGRINQEASRSAAGTRHGPCYTEGLDGSRVWFPDHASIDASLKRLWSWLTANRGRPLLKATVAYCCVCNLHPFTDGNGRVARWLFTSILRQEASLASTFIPLHEFFRRSQGSFVVYLRLAELRNDWDALVKFLAQVIVRMAQQQRSAAVGFS